MDGDYAVGVLARRDASTSNYWTDGTFGVTRKVRSAIDSHGCLPHCVKCGDEAAWKEEG